MWMSLCNQNISPKKNLRKHSSEVHEGRSVWLNTLLQFTMLRNHSNVTFVTPVFTKRNTLLRFMKVRNLSHVIYLCNQSYLKKESLRRHISAVHWKVIWSKRHILSVHDEKTKLFKCSICEALVLKNLLLSNPLLGFLAMNNKSK